MGLSAAFAAQLPTPDDGVWVACQRLTFADTIVEPDQAAAQVFDLSDNALRGLWATGQIRFERYRAADQERADLRRIRAEVKRLEAQRAELVLEVERLEGMAARLAAAASLCADASAVLAELAGDEAGA